MDAPSTDTTARDNDHSDPADIVSMKRSELPAFDPDTVAHSNCGQMVYCHDSNGVPEYQCFKNSGCTLDQWTADMRSDCDYVCGSSACGTIDIQNYNQCAHP